MRNRIVGEADKITSWKNVDNWSFGCPRFAVFSSIIHLIPHHNIQLPNPCNISGDRAYGTKLARDIAAERERERGRETAASAVR